MQANSWELEVHAREMRQRWQREAERARQLAACQRGDQPRVAAPRFSLSRWLVALRCFLPLPRGASKGAAASLAAVAPLALAEPQPTLNARSSGLAQPYAGMVVLARGASAPNAVQPCVTSDC